MDTITLKFTQPQFNTLVSALAQRPYGEVATTMASIQAQVAAVQQAEHDAAADARDQPSGAQVPA